MHDVQLHPQRLCRCLQGLDSCFVYRVGQVCEEGHEGGLWYHLLEHLKRFPREGLYVDVCHPGNVPSWSLETRDQPSLHRIGHAGKDNGNRIGDIARRQRCSGKTRHEDIHLEPD